MKKSILVYYDGGDLCLGTSTDSRKKIIRDGRNKGHIGYLAGYRSGSLYQPRYNNQSVICFFKEQPSPEEIQRRRANGFKAARWTKFYTPEPASR